MKKKVAYYSLIVFMLLSPFITTAQRAVDAVLQSFNEYRTKNIEEKLFVHTDKGFYMAGEIIWFKVYAVDAHLNKPLSLSKISYAELLTKDNKPVLQAKIAMSEEGTGDGSFQLPYSVGSGNYIFRAYTNWMKNAGETFFFEKDIVIVNSLKKPEWPVADTELYDVQFFPEGGNMVHNIQSKVAFKITDVHGNGVNSKGVVLNSRNDTIVRFASLRFGMGHFNFTPDAGEKYHAVLFTSDGASFSKPLPAINTSGIVMQLRELDQNRLSLSIESKNAGSIISLLVHTRNVVKYALSTELFGGRTEIEIDKKKLGEGISQFTVFDGTNRAVCERLFFSKPDTLSINLTTDAQQYGERKKVTIELDTHDAKQLPVSGNLSMSVYLLDSLQTLEPGNILSYLWLTSDLKGKIESPDYYFRDNSPEVQEATDNLMLTQGWRRFNWDAVLQTRKTEPEYPAETEGHIITGKIVDKRNGKTAENVQAYLSVPAEKSLFSTITSSQNGVLRFNMMNFYGGNEVIVQTNSSADSMFRIDIGNPFFEKYSNRQLMPLAVTETQSSLLLSHSISSQVGNAYYADKHQQFLYPKNADTTAFYGLPDKRYYLDDYTRFITMEEVMREYVAEVAVSKNKNHFRFRVWNEPYKKYFESDPLVLMDGVPVFDVDKIINFDPLKIKKLDVMSHKFYQHNQVHEGILNFSTYQGDLAGYSLDANALIIEYEGLQLQREFYSPKYASAESINSRLPDYRNLLYWLPEIHSGKNGKQQLSFYTADIPGNYGIVVQGITVNGLSGSKTIVFKVAH